MWIDIDVLKCFRTMAEHEGEGYQTMLNAALKLYTTKGGERLREIVRHVVRKELRAAPREVTYCERH